MAVIERDHYPDNALNKLDTALNDIEKLKRTASTAGITTSDVSALIAAHAADSEAHHATIPDATETVKGIAELATTTEAQTGTDTERIVTPAGLRADVPATPAASRGVRLNATGHLILPATGDVFPYSAGRGVFTRFVDGGVAYDEHFRGANTIPTGYAWQGSPFASPSTIIYNNRSDFILAGCPVASRMFMSRAVTNAAANWQNKTLYGRFCAALNGRAGLRLDDGTDNNYGQIFIDGTANDGTETIKFQYRVGGGAVTTATSNIVVPAFQLMNLMLLSLYSGGLYYVLGYLVQPEVGQPVNISGFATNAAWAPAAGRAGIFMEDPAGTDANALFCDWLKNEFV